MNLAQLVPLYLTIVMVILVVVAMTGPGEKTKKDSADKE